MPRLLLGVSGGIAAYKALELVRLATGEGHAVRVIQTRTAQRFVGAASFAALSGAPVLSSEFERDPLRGSFPGDPLPTHDPASHLALSAAADVLLIAPASANTIAKLAHGLADNLLTSAALGASCPVIVAPAMNDRMWEHAATQANLALLRERGIEVLTPGTGRLATHGEWGPGRLPEPAELLAAVNAALGAGRWSGTRTLVTAGGTREPIDAVRFVGNRSSGRMGFAIADAASARGSEVVVVAANVSLPRARRRALSRRDDRGRARRGVRARVRRRRRARDVRGGGRLPAAQGRGARQDRQGRAPSTWRSSSRRPRTCSPRSRRAAATGRRWSVSQRSTATARSRAPARSSSTSAWTRSSATTCRRRASASTPSATR